MDFGVMVNNGGKIENRLTETEVGLILDLLDDELPDKNDFEVKEKSPPPSPTTSNQISIRKKMTDFLNKPLSKILKKKNNN
jgi:hypothetical protein